MLYLFIMMALFYCECTSTGIPKSPSWPLPLVTAQKDGAKTWPAGGTPIMPSTPTAAESGQGFLAEEDSTAARLTAVATQLVATAVTTEEDTTTAPLLAAASLAGCAHKKVGFARYQICNRTDFRAL